MVAVSPPPYIVLPKEFLEDTEKREYFQQQNFIIYQLWKRTGGSEDNIAALANSGPSLSSRLITLEQRIGSGDALTSDETGFTVDSTIFSVDMDES